MKFLLFLNFLVLVWAKDRVPVVIFGEYEPPGVSPPNLPVSALSDVKELHFGQILHQLTQHRPHILLFMEHTLSVEDLSWHEEDSHVYNHLMAVSQSPGFLYFPSVESPISVIRQLTHHGYSFANYDEDSPPIPASPTILTSVLRDPEPAESRRDFLRAHDQHISRISQEAIRKYGRVLVLYTGRRASFVEPNDRRKREAEEEGALSPLGGGIDNKIVLTDKKIYIVTDAPIVFQKGDVTTNLSRVIFTSTESKPNIALDVKFKEIETSLDWVFDSASESESWSLEHILVESDGVKLRAKRPMYAPAGYSYFCARDITFTGTKNGTQYSVVMHGIQAQPWVSANAFGPAADCVPYFSEPIWSGLIIATLLLGVLFLAIIFIIDIKPMDRFDDPKGKTLTISNVE